MSLMDTDTVTSLDASLIKGEKAYLQFLISRHMDRMNQLITQKGMSTNDEAGLFSVVNSSLKAFEAMVTPFVSEEYFKTAKDYKKKCDDFESSLRGLRVEWVDCFNVLMDWYALLVTELNKIGMIPLREEEIIVPHRPDDEIVVSEVEVNDGNSEAT